MNHWVYIVLMLINVVKVYVSEETTLTTASFKELTPPIPTMTNRRMSNLQENMFRARSKPQKFPRQPPNENREWGWDKWCLMQPKPGNCKEKQSLFYYDTQIDECREFVYTGCNGNENKFATIKECEQFCKGYGMVMEPKSLTQFETCSLQPDPGMCLAAIGRYFFDIATRKCRPFIFGGCGGNSNRFLDEETCLEKCATVSGGKLQIWSHEN